MLMWKKQVALLEQEYKEMAESTGLEDEVLATYDKYAYVKDFFGEMGMEETEIASQKIMKAVMEKMNSDADQVKKDSNYLARLNTYISVLNSKDRQKLAEYKERKNIRKDWRRLAAVAYHYCGLEDLTQGVEEYFGLVRQGHQFFMEEALEDEPEWEIVSHWEYYSLSVDALDLYHKTNANAFAGFLNPEKKRMKELLRELGQWEADLSKKIGAGPYHAQFMTRLETLRMSI